MLIRTDDQNYIGIANSIRQLNGKSDLYTPAQMRDELEALYPSRGIIYESFDENGDLLSATVYGDTVGSLAYNDKMTTVTFADNVTTVSSNAFRQCTSLNLATLPETIKSIGVYAFENCKGVTISKLPSSLETLSGSAFYGCANIPSMKLNDGLKSIGSYPFVGCPNVTITEIPDSVEYLYVEAFCSTKTASSLKLPKNLKYLGPYVFAFNSTLTSVTFQCVPTEHFDKSAFSSRNGSTSAPPIKHIYVPWGQGEVDGAPWGAKSATVHYNTAV